MTKSSNDRSIYFEFRSLGRQVRVCAIDEATGVEVVITGPVTAPRQLLKQIAARKLMRSLSTRSKGK